MSMLAFPLAFPFAFPFGAAGDDSKKRGDEDGTCCLVAWGVACTDAVRDRRGAGEDIFGRWLLVRELRISRWFIKVDATTRKVARVFCAKILYHSRETLIYYINSLGHIHEQISYHCEKNCSSCR